jgi:hypothetical protein
VDKTIISWLLEADSARKTLKILNDTSSITTSGKSDGQLKGFAVESLARESWATNNSKELNEAGRNNSSLALKATSVAASEWELFVTE